MSPLRKLLLVTAGAIALCAVQACSSGTELNPQPLPPGHEPGPEDPNQKGSDSTGGNGGSSGATPLPGASDAGAEGGDSGDGGDR